ncbi:hypothetical protein AJ79_05842 [Helicocarpus griseus UAMH5409]|uniref:DUF7703 domain-containing protein n=1 Tax=Helicocarpus griseus UAMH5409 TaxID=1447875 RepID=A0A2B7XJN5_9EURO|nr:hypothetical protein AJ79_05842 [Helicocarpus griseus UAMH5409]
MATPPAMPEALFGMLTTIGEVTVFMGFTGICWFNNAELLMKVFLFFRQYTGVYFYSLIFSALGTACYQSFLYVLILNKMNVHGALSGLQIGWTFMVTGQSLVLWSRLHLILVKTKILKMILAMIVFSTVTMVPLLMSTAHMSLYNEGLILYAPFTIAEKVEISVFSVQELIISCVYLYTTWKMLRIRDVLQKGYTKRLMRHLVIVNIFIIALDITLLVLEFVTPMGIWGSFKGFAYSIKLKLEFHTLNKLKESPKRQGTETGLSGNLRSDELDTIRKNQWNGAIHKSTVHAGSSSPSVQTSAGTQIMRTTDFMIDNENGLGEEGAATSKARKGSPTSSLVEFASKGN